MNQPKRIRAIPVDPDKFEPFGEVLMTHKNIELDLGQNSPTVEIFSVPFREFVFDEMSRHIKSTQVFIPLGGKDFIIAVAPPSDINDAFAVPSIEEIKAFHVYGSRGICLNKGCWHSTPFPLCYKAQIAIIQCKKTFEEDLDLKKLKMSINILFE